MSWPWFEPRFSWLLAQRFQWLNYPTISSCNPVTLCQGANAPVLADLFSIRLKVSSSHNSVHSVWSDFWVIIFYGYGKMQKYNSLVFSWAIINKNRHGSKNSSVNCYQGQWYQLFNVLPLAVDLPRCHKLFKVKYFQTEVSSKVDYTILYDVLGAKKHIILLNQWKDSGINIAVSNQKRFE